MKIDSKTNTAKPGELISHLGLKPHPEGGYFRETYRSAGFIGTSVAESEYLGPRNYATAIYFLLTSDTFSTFHRIQQDEIWHFYQGSPLLLHTLTPEGKYSCTEVGNDLVNGQLPQVVVPGGVWFGATVKNQNEYSLVGCTVSPGFDFRDFELAERKALLRDFPEHGAIISQLTRL